MSQSMTVIQADMGQTDPAKNNFVENQAGAQATASANAAALIATAIAALQLGTAAMAAATAFDASGAASAAQTAAIASSASSLTAAIAALATVGRTGAYSDLSGKPSLGTQMSVDTGWSANSTAGDKTAVLTAFTNNISGAMVTALDLTSPGLGTALSGMADMLVLVVKKLAAHETALVAAKLPSA